MGDISKFPTPIYVQMPFPSSNHCRFGLAIKSGEHNVQTEVSQREGWLWCRMCIHLAHKQSAMHALAVLSRVMLINCACAVLWTISMPVFVTVRGLSKSSPTPSHLFVIFIVLSITIAPQAPSIFKKIHSCGLNLILGVVDFHSCGLNLDVVDFQAFVFGVQNCNILAHISSKIIHH